MLELQEFDLTQVGVTGGKAAHLGELLRIEGIHVPACFCVTTDAYRRIVADSSSIDEQIDRLSSLTLADHEEIRVLSAEIRRHIEKIRIPDDLVSAILRQLIQLGEHVSYAVRSSATAEDMPMASVAGQQDTYLNVMGSDAILRHVSQCWASLYTERSVTYRLRNGFDHRKVQMAVVVQQLVSPLVSGVLFTADPVTGNRKITLVEASYGLGEALVSGMGNADVYKVRAGEAVARSVASKQLAIRASPVGGTHEAVVESEYQDRPALSDAQVVRLAELGRRIESHFGRPQDIEWCLVEGDFRFVQSRPITTLYPIPETGDAENHVLVSVGHQQMMTDPMKPLGLSLFQMTARPRMFEAGGRLFVDVIQMLSSAPSRASLLELMGNSDPLIKDALQMILDRGDFSRTVAEDGAGRVPAGPATELIEIDSAIVADLIERNQASVASLRSAIKTKTGLELLEFIRADISELQRILFDPQSHQVIMAGMEATRWLKENLQAWLGEKNAADILT